uniref:Uncharacterized protein n=1 Tax=Physcomitrium patens TaxID=3218 RepID=A0A2K1K328_PHYPA|nr:hypothetical protein PHYPA_012657 [Physcomitrium patens]
MDAYQAYLVIYLNAHMNVVSPELFVLAVMCHLYDYPQNHTLNLFLLGLLTVAMSLSIGISSSMALRTSLDLTTMVVVSLTGYTYWAAKKGMDFHFLGPLLFTSLLVLNFFGFIQIRYSTF